MARRGKTKLGEGSREQSRLMMQAAESGRAGVRRAHEGLMHAKEGQLAQGERIAQQTGEALRYAEQQQLAEREQGFREQAETGRQALQARGQNLQAANLGLEVQDQGQTGSPLLDRQQRLEQEMERGAQQRRAQQGEQPLEMPGSRQAFVPSERRQAAEESERALEAEKAATERIRALAYRQQVSASLAKARAAGDKEELKRRRADLLQPLKSRTDQLDRLMQFKGTAEDWKALQKMTADLPQVGERNAALLQAIEQRQMTPEVRDFISREMSIEGLKYIKDSQGELPDSKYIDYTAPAMQQFVRSTEIARNIFAILGSDFSTRIANVFSFEDKNRMVNGLAAGHALDVLSNPVRAQADQGMLPSQQMSPEQQQAQQQPYGAQAGPLGIGGAAGPAQPQQPQAPPLPPRGGPEPEAGGWGQQR